MSRCKMTYLSEPYTRSEQLNQINYAIKSDLKNTTGVNFAKKSDLASLKSDIDKLDNDSLEKY